MSDKIHVAQGSYCENCEDEAPCDRCVMKEVLKELDLPLNGLRNAN